MSKILKGLNEVNPNNYDSDWDYQDAVAKSGKSRSNYRSQEDDTSDADIAYSKKMYQLGQQQKAAKEKAQRDSDHDRLATGTNESARDYTGIYSPEALKLGTRFCEHYNITDDNDIQLAIELIDGYLDIYKMQNIPVNLNDLKSKLASDFRQVYRGMGPGPSFRKKFQEQEISEVDNPWGDQGNFAGDKPVSLGNVSIKNIQTGDTVKYLGQSSKVVAMSKNRKYSRITITKGMGTVTQDVLTSDLQQLGQGKTIEEDNTNRMKMDDYHNLADALQEKLRQAIKVGNNELVDKLSKERADLDARVKKYGLIPESQLDELDTKLGLYKIAAGKDATAADKAGDYKRGHKRFKGIMKATEKEFANDAKKKKDADEKKSAISQGINEFSPIKPPTAGAFGGNKDYGQPTSSRYLGNNKFVVGTTNNYVLTATVDKWGLEWDEDDEIWFLDSPGAVYIADATEGEIELPAPQEQRNQIHDLVTDYLNEINSADLQKVAAYFGHSDDGEMATNEGTADEKPAEPFKTGYPRVNNPKILGTQNRAKSIYHPPSKPNVKKLDKPLPENLGNELKSKSLEALQQVKQKLEQQRMAELEQWEQDFKQNTVSKFTAREPNFRQRATSTSMVAMPGEKHSELKTRLGQLNKAIEKQGILDNLVQKLDKKGLLTPNIEAGVDTSMLARDGARDNYVELNKKLDKALEYVKNRLLTNKAAYAKPKAIDEEQLDELSCWSGYHRVAGTKAGFPGSCKKNKTNEEEIDEINRRGFLKGLGAGAAAGYIGKKINDTEVYVVKGYGGTSVSVYATSPEDAINNVLNDKTYNPALFKNATATLIPRTEIEKQDQINKSYDKKLNPDELRQRLHNISVGDPDFSVRRWIGSPDSVRKHQVNGTEYQFWYYNGGLSLDFFDGKLQAIHKSNKMILKDSESCPHCGGEMVSEELMNEKKDACYYKVKSRYKVWPSAYASGALVKCRKKGADSWGNGGKKNESSILEGIERADESLHDWFNKEKWVRMDTKGNIKGPCAREPGEGKPKCLPQSKAHSLGKKGRASAAQRKRREDPNPERSGKAINVDTKKSKG